MDFKKLLLDNDINLSRSGKSYRCHICLRAGKRGKKTAPLLGDISTVENHVQSYSHQKSLRKLKKGDFKNSALLINVRYCTQCQVSLIDDETYRCHCLLHFYKIHKDCLANTDIVKFNFYNEGKIINCLLCNEELNDEKVLALHLQSDDHTNRLNLLYRLKIPKILEDSINCKMNISNLTNSSESNNESNIIIVLFCTLCNQNILKSNITEHIKENHNEDKLLGVEFEDDDEIETSLSDLYRCFVCDKAYSNQMLLLKHFNSKEHIYISKNVHQILESSHFVIKTRKYRGIVFCKICSSYLTTIDVALYHMQSLKHSLKLVNIGTNINSASNNTPMNVLNPVCSLQHNVPNLTLEDKASNSKYSRCDDNDINNVLNKLVPIDKSQKKVNIFKSKRKDNKSKPHSQSNFDINLWNFANDYIEMCIKPGEKNIYNVELELETIISTSYLVKNIWYYAQVFICNICSKRINFEIDFIIHLVSENHTEKLRKLKLQNKEARFYVCPTCVTCWYGEADTFEIHCEGDMHKKFLNFLCNEFVVPELSRIVIDLLIEVDKNVNHLLNVSNKTYNEEQEKEHKLLKSIETVAQVAYPQAKAYIFGSRRSYLGFPDSDVDVFLDCKNVYHNKLCSNKQSEKYLKTVKNLLILQEDSWIVEEVLLKTRVPILKLKHIDTNLKCDISFLNGLSVEKSRLIRYFNKACPDCRQLILYLKRWLKYCRLLGAHGITTYAVSWFVIFYLQTENILPSVHSLLETNQTKLVDGWNCSFTDIIPVVTKNFTFNELLKKFFLFYAAFDYQSNVICPLLGKIVKKSSFAKRTELPKEMNVYKERLNRGEIEFFRLDSPMCIQDPVDQSQNMTKAVPKHLLRYFIVYCAVSAEYLKTHI